MNSFEPSSLPIAWCPDWVVERCGRGDERIADSPPPAFINQESARRRTVEYLTCLAPIAVEGDGGNSTTLEVAERVGDFGLSEVECLADMSEFYNPRCLPSWSADELATLVRNAYKYRKTPVGSASPEAQFTVIEQPPEHVQNAAKRRFTATLFSEIEPKYDQIWTIHHVLPATATALLTAEPGKAKTFIAIEMGVAIALGTNWHGRETLQGAVVYFSAEGQLANRLEARRQYDRLAGKKIPFAVIEDGANFRTSTADVDALVTETKRIEVETGQPLRLIIIDTLNQIMAGGAENSAEDMGAVISNLARIKRETGATVLVIHHTGKEPGRGPRGHSSLVGAADVSLEIEESAVVIKKQRDGEIGGKFCFRIEAVKIGTDRKGRPVTSAVTIPDTGRDFTKRRPKAGSRAAQLLAVAEDLAPSHSSKPRRISLEAWKSNFIARHFPGKAKPGWTAFERAKNVLISMGLSSIDHEDVIIAT